jgi:flavin reductase (DIM6/NTAB) family NADH-FMN oxidoreductase RutF
MSGTATLLDPSFRQALGSFATGVTIVTTLTYDGKPLGLTANSFNSVSLDPPQVLWSLACRSGALPSFLHTRRFNVQVLSAGQMHLARHYATRDSLRFTEPEWRTDRFGLPLLDGACARFHCALDRSIESGDHVIMIGAVEHFDALDQPPLLFAGGRFLSVDPACVGL